MKSIEECYRVFGLPVGATQDQIRKAYLAQVMAWHPDHYHHHHSKRLVAEERLKALNLAYETITQKRFQHPSDLKFGVDGRRYYPRKAISTSIRFKVRGIPLETFRGEIINISGGGLFIRSPRTVVKNSRVYLNFTLPGFGDIIGMRGEVARRIETGMGIQFVISKSYRRLIAEFI